jgi:hypothetical protein
MLADAEHLDVRSRFRLFALRVVIGHEVEIPKLDVKLRGGTDRREDNMSPFR